MSYSVTAEQYQRYVKCIRSRQDLLLEIDEALIVLSRQTLSTEEIQFVVRRVTEMKRIIDSNWGGT